MQNFGCRATQADGAVIERQFRERGLEDADSVSEAQIVVVNTCTVTAAADHEARRTIRRIRRENPTIEEALVAAESLAEDPAQRAEIAATLMGVPVEEVRALAAKQAAKTRGRASLVAGRTRAVVVEYKRPRLNRPTISLGKKR